MSVPRVAVPSTSARAAELLAQIVEEIGAQRDDLALWTVYADQLQSENDPRGALVAMMLERERAPSPKLLGAERAYRKRHQAALVPASWHRFAHSIVWRRGFPVEVTLTMPSQLADVIASPYAKLLESVRIELRDEPDDWLAAIQNEKLPWRRLRLAIEAGDEQVELAPWFAALPALEHARVVVPEYDNPVVSLEGVVAEHLRSLAIDRAGEVYGLDTAELPALAELRLLGETPPGELFESELCDQLSMLVVNHELTDEPPEREGLAVLRHVRPDEYEWREDAFVVVARLVDTALVEDVARGLPGIRSLDVQVGHLASEGLTLVRTYATELDSLVPYGLAVALSQQLPSTTPFALFHQSSRTNVARGCTLAAPPVRKSVPLDQACELLRTLLDEQTGRDPGNDVLELALEALDCAPRETIVAGSHTTELAVDIDPGSLGPLPEYDEFDEYEQPHATTNDLYEPPSDAPDPFAEAVFEEPPPLALEVRELAREVDAPDDVEGDTADELAVGDTTDGALRIDRLPDGRHAWIELLSVWAERERDPDDELAPRFADPELAWSDNPDIDFEAQPAPASCEDCDAPNVALYACAWCGGGHCASCSVRPESGGIWCHACIAELAHQRTSTELPDELTPDDVAALDAEVDEDLAEIRASHAFLDEDSAPDDYDY